ncbi:hypothetical protein K3495_g318 [Podosphaera aphanis]|nr:hypothetical protein K3495_g318 [Podosphaera aphanis]
MRAGTPQLLAVHPPSIMTSSSNALDRGAVTSDVCRGETSRPQKLHGRAFYESLGSPKLVLAPMVDQSEFAWRMLTRSFLPPSAAQTLVAYTPMFHARMFGDNHKFRDAHFQPLRTSLTSHSPLPAADLFLDGHPAFDRPLFAQFCANNPQELLTAARFVAPFCDAVDLNLGCPQGIARKGKYGAFLQEDQSLIFSLINILHRELDVPVTAKIRILETREKTLEYARNLLKAGASILTIHGRTRDMKGHKTGLADWSIIQFLRENLPRDTVIFANGNILRNEDISRCLQETGADAVMSAEGNLYDPAIFATAPPIGQEGREYWRGRDRKGGWRMDAVFRRYLNIIYKYVLEIPPPTRNPLYLPTDLEMEVEVIKNEEGKRERCEEKDAAEENPAKKKQRKTKAEKTTNPNLLAMQPHLFHFLRPLVARHHHVRDALARCRAGDIPAFESVLQMVEEVVKSGLKEYEATDGKSWETEYQNDERLKNACASILDQDLNDMCKNSHDTRVEESSIATVKECKRPWWVVQPHVRPLPIEALAKGSWQLNKKEKMALLETQKGDRNSVKTNDVNK